MKYIDMSVLDFIDWCVDDYFLTSSSCIEPYIKKEFTERNIKFQHVRDQSLPDNIMTLLSFRLNINDTHESDINLYHANYFQKKYILRDIRGIRDVIFWSVKIALLRCFDKSYKNRFTFFCLYKDNFRVFESYRDLGEKKTGLFSIIKRNCKTVITYTVLLRFLILIMEDCGHAASS